MFSSRGFIGSGASPVRSRIAAGVHPKIVQERLGHSQIGITLDIYSHVLPTMGLEAAGKLDTLLRGKSTKSKKASAAD